MNREWLDYCIDVGIPETEIAQTVVDRSTLRCGGVGQRVGQAPHPATKPAPRRGLWRILEMIFGKAAAFVLVSMLIGGLATSRATGDTNDGPASGKSVSRETSILDREEQSKLGAATPTDFRPIDLIGGPASTGDTRTDAELERQWSRATTDEPPESEGERSADWVVITAAAFAAASCMLAALMWWRIERRVIRFHRAFLSVTDSGVASRMPERESGPAPPPESRSVARVGWYGDAEQLLAELARVSSRLGSFRLMRPTKPWSLGLISATGPVRERNEDFGVAFRLVGLADVDVVVLADGLGGAKRGAEAAFAAVRGACEAVIRRLSAAIQCDRETLRAAVDHGFEAAVASVRRAAEAHGLTDDGCFQTTLIIVVASKGDVVWTHIGDGLGVVLDNDGGTRSWLVPQKADPSRPNVLSACLGPQLLGQPRVGSLRRKKGDLIVIGTDGIADFVNPAFPVEVALCAAARDGDLHSTAKAIVELMAAQMDDDGPLCSDNMSIALVGTGRSPFSKVIRTGSPVAASA